MAAGQFDIYIEQNADFKMILTIRKSGQPIDISDHTFYGQLRKTASTKTSVANFDFTIGDQTQLATLGSLVVMMSGDVTALIPCGTSQDTQPSISFFAYDIFSVSPTAGKTKWLQGTARVAPAVTQGLPQ